jgi:hypothetical protein
VGSGSGVRYDALELTGGEVRDGKWEGRKTDI